MSAKRDHLVDTALALFYRGGYHATGIDRILGESGVARMTLYKHFRSKDDLILAALRRRDEQFRAWFAGAVERRGETPKRRLLAIFDVLEDWFAGKAFPGQPFAGCAFINATAEFGKAGGPVQRAAAEHKQLLLEFARDLAARAGASDPDALARDLMLLKEGAVVTAQVSRDNAAASRAKAIARPLIEAALAAVE